MGCIVSWVSFSIGLLIVASHALSYILVDDASGIGGASKTMFIACVSMISLIMCAPLRVRVGYLCVAGRGVLISSA